ncbi:LOW QUALITY PROTEIN: non-functional pseudokinase ZED1 [Brassica rapa]|uniref:LOW QUALITY PROTEIN: non-functional pseudokinase ZED1 n=1 Tax=Brassica campestris TaxID=3711 RepID=UPI00142DC24D|nr:LOW QUALITY PROTEIN: non-functional pseudokinase ZED1 [Brassica rapa]
MKCWRRKKEKDKARKCFLENGSMFLEQLIADCNGISNPIRMFSSDQISKATNQFDPMCSLPHISPYFTWYKGVIEGRSYLIKRFIHPVVGEEERAYSDCLFLKLIGSCLEFPLPVLVYEDLEYRALNIRGSVGSEDGPLLPWNVHLKIAKEVATAITYLHTAFPRIILHRDIKAANVFLDKNWKASLTDFSSAVTLPEGYVDSYYLATGIVTEYSDVFSFGILMLVLLLGRPQLLPDGHSDFRTSVLDYVKDLRERGEPVEFGGDMRPGQMNMLLDLALRYCEERNEDRPKMISVAKEIKLIEQASL